VNSSRPRLPIPAVNQVVSKRMVKKQQIDGPSAEHTCCCRYELRRSMGIYDKRSAAGTQPEDVGGGAAASRVAPLCPGLGIAKTGDAYDETLSDQCADLITITFLVNAAYRRARPI
jgi:hypothetical protein